MLKLGFLASHTGSNMQAIIDACQAGTLAAEPRVVISNNSQSGALARARQANIAAYHLRRADAMGRCWEKQFWRRCSGTGLK